MCFIDVGCVLFVKNMHGIFIFGSPKHKSAALLTAQGCYYSTDFTRKKRRLGIPLEFLPSWLSPSSLQLALTPPFAPKWVRKGRFWTPRQLDFYPVWLSPSNLQPALASLSPLCGRGGWRLDGLMQARCSPNWPSTQALPCILLLLHV